MNAHDTPIAATDTLTFYGRDVGSRLMLGTAQYASPAILEASVYASGASIVTVSLRREAARQGLGENGKSGPAAGQVFFDMIRGWDVDVLPNTAGCRTAKDAITTALMAREIFETPWIKLEVIANDDTLQPDVFQLVEAAEELSRQDFCVFPYTTDDLGVGERLLAAGCDVLMPWGAPIGSGRGLANPYALRAMRNYFPDVPLVVDAGIGAPSHAAHAMELGYDAVLLNTAVAKAHDAVSMADAFGLAVRAGRAAFTAGVMEPRDMAAPSTPVAGTPFFDVA